MFVCESKERTNSARRTVESGEQEVKEGKEIGLEGESDCPA